ncbi:RluA family pseudouridine synthase [Rubrivirga sp.]|uniref:RluA family pseudouridine synthase n=1 Tax=Rubrivirga sp. TaxID=1885344 RepID=UPI003C78C8C4
MSAPDPYERVEAVLTLDVPPGQSPIRLDVYVTEKTANATRSKVQRGIKDGRVDVNGKTAKKPSMLLQPGDHVECRVIKMAPIEVVPEDIPLDVVYEDDVLIVVNKPAGMVVHPAYGHPSGTLVNALLWHVGGDPIRADDLEDADDDDVGLSTSTAGPRFEGDPTVRPGLVHRLDKDTTGLMVATKTDTAAAILGKQFAERTIRRRYLALVWGVLDPEEGRVESWLGRSPRDRRVMSVRPEGEGKWAATRYQTVEAFRDMTLARFQLETGRTHQIRVHASSMGHPVFGDATYKGDRIVYGSAVGTRKAFIHNLLKAHPRQALHAHTLGFTHPATGQDMDFEAPLPADTAHLVERIRTIEGA